MFRNAGQAVMIFALLLVFILMLMYSGDALKIGPRPAFDRMSRWIGSTFTGETGCLEASPGTCPDNMRTIEYWHPDYQLDD